MNTTKLFWQLLTLTAAAGRMALVLTLIIGLSACSSSEDAIEQTAPGSPATAKTYTLTVTATKSPEDNALARAIAEASGDGATRALSLITEGNTKTLSATWDADEKIRVLKRKQQSSITVFSEIGTLAATTVSDDGLTATFTGTLSPSKISSAGGLEAGDKLLLGFPGENLGSNNSSSFVFNYNGQDGSLEKIASDYDFCMTKTSESKMVTVASADAATGIVTTTADAEFQNQQAIVRFTLYESDGTTAVLPKSLDITAIGLEQAVSLPESGEGIAIATPTEQTLTLKPDGSTNVIYAALRGISGQTVKLTATDANGYKYTYTTKNPVSFRNGQFYDIKVKMKALTVNLSKVTAAGLTEQYGSSTLTLEDGMTLTGTLDGATQKVKIQIAAGAMVTLHNATINGYHYDDTDFPGAGITCLGDATIVLSGENSVRNFNRYYPAILAAHNASGDEYTLTIRGTGKLTATNEYWGAGIGGGDYMSCGNICIEGGEITATSHDATGIGCGTGMYGSSSCGAITINGGTVTATSGVGAAGIGCGNGMSGSSSCGAITINGGTVTATGGELGAGIGCGNGERISNSCGAITINGGTVTANGGNNAAGIGSGNRATCGAITITGGNITATGGGDMGGAGIGSGQKATCGAITISGGTVTAMGKDEAAGIGCGYGDYYIPSSCGDIRIGSDGSKTFSVTAIRGKSALWPIGHSNRFSDYNSCGNIIFGTDEDNKVYTANDDPASYQTGNRSEYVNFYESTTVPEGVDETPENPGSYENNTWMVWRYKILEEY